MLPASHHVVPRSRLFFLVAITRRAHRNVDSGGKWLDGVAVPIGRPIRRVRKPSLICSHPGRMAPW